MLNDLSVVAISFSVIMLCWVVVRLNQKLEEAMFNLKSNKNLETEDELDDYENSEKRQSLSGTRS